MSNRFKDFPTDKLRSLLPELSSLLEADLHMVEPHFAQLGQNLQSVYGESSSLAEEIMTFANAITSQEQGSLRHDVQKIVDDSLTVLSSCQGALNGSIKNINSCTVHLRELCSICEGMQKSAVFLNVVGLNISVEGCRTKEVMEMFKNFGEEIKQLAGNIGEISTTISENSEKARKDQVDVRDDITGGMETFDQLSLSAETAVQHAVEELTTIGIIAASTLEKASSHSQEISKTVGEIVISIQSHDIIRQQVEHIVSALADVISFLDPDPEESEHPEEDNKPDGKNNEDEALKKGRIQSILSLQTAQLKHVVEEIKAVYSKMQADFKNIGNAVNLLMENVDSSRSESTGAPPIEEKLEEFKTELKQLRKLLAKGDHLEEKINQTMETSSNAVSTLSHHTARVSSINIDLQYKAINAIIMTSKLGDKGATLEVLARSVRDLSGELDALVKDVLNEIKAITDLAGTSDQNNAPPQKQTGKIGASVQSLDEGITRISAAFGIYRQSVAESGEKAEQLMKSIKNTGKALDFLPSWIEGATHTLEKLESLMEELSPWEAIGNELAAEIKEDISRRYTMEKERKIHEQITTAGEKNTTSNPDTDIDPPDAESEDDLDDNIELF